MPRRLVDRIVRRLELPAERDARAGVLIDTEWIVTNGLGGYASSTMAGVITRRYHGILVAALPNPLGRIVMLNHLGERLVLDGRATFLNSEERAGGRLDADAAALIEDARLEAGLPVWEYRWEGIHLEKRIFMPHRQNTVHVTYRLLDGPTTARLELHPAVHFRGYEDPVGSEVKSPTATRYTMATSGGMHLLSVENGKLPPLRLKIHGTEANRFIADERVTSEFVYPVEESRGYEFRGALWTPGHFEVDLPLGDCVTLMASAEPEEVMVALSPDEVVQCEQERRRRLILSALPQAQDETGAELVLAADQFIITPAGRIVDATRAAAMGNEVRTVIAGYHWFTDWGRDTMISLEGLTLMTGRQRESAFILRTFAHYVRDGLIPNMFPDGSNEGLYHTADATLWFFHAVERYVRRTGDQTTLMHLLPTMVDIVEHHVQGTKFGIGIDPSDGLLRQGAEGYQLTWMDAKVDGWVVTPRRGKAVEINALWYNALRLLQGWLAEIRGTDAAKSVRQRADCVYESFNKRFWIDDKGYLYDVVDGEHGDSAECRPNQVLSVSLDHAVLDPSRWKSVLDVVEQRLLTPVGLRSLAPGEPDYKNRYFGDLRSRDAAYHQGTVWAWLIGPWIDAWLKVHPDDRAGARRFLDGSIAALGGFGLGTIGEIFDAEPPYTPRGCIAQAWSVAEVLRCWAKTAPDVTA
ncbi:MAG TPA: amylo-alpha-1,6-glucosidase [Gemmatimonadaceae bacterium]|jgi:predicted glycogen debranching enzyme|nr:amylo-alpha-1,6-glucosidase [Gemmatimonadaceae bacterium]